MTESNQTPTDQQIILNARVTIYLDGLILTRFTKDFGAPDNIGQAGILTTLDDHCLRILVRGKGQLGQVWPLRDSSGNIPHIPYTSLKKMLALWLYVSTSDKYQIPQGSAGKLYKDPEYTFDGLLDFDELHRGASITPNILAPLKIPQGQFYMAQKTKFKLVRGGTSVEKEYSSLTGVAIDHQLNKRSYLILEPELPAGSNNLELNLLPAIIPLEPGARYEVIIQNAPIVESSHSHHSMHFEKFYAAFPGIPKGDRYSLELVDPPKGSYREVHWVRAYPNSPPCTSPRYNARGDFVWIPDGAGHH